MDSSSRDDKHASDADGPSRAARELAARIDARTVRVGVIGLGYVGLPLVSAFATAGIETVGFDIDPTKIATLQAGETYLRHLGDDFGRRLLETGAFRASADFAELASADAILLCVPTPLGAHREPDLSHVDRTVARVATTLRPGQLVVLESTTWPGTTRERLAPALEATGLRVGRDVFLAYAPERQDPGRTGYSVVTTPRLVGGVGQLDGELAAALYRLAVDEVHLVRSSDVAEAAKLLENVFRAVNIALVNETKTLFTALGIDIWEVIAAASTKPFGFTPFYPGPGLGGHCIPIDPYYLAWRARAVGLETRFVELAGEVNRAMPAWVVGRTIAALNDVGVAPSRARLLVLGLAYKPDVDDTRESPAFPIIEQLRELGADVDYHDPLIPRTAPKRDYDLGMTAIELSAEALASYSAVIVCTDHRTYDFAWIGEHARIVVDTRNAMAGIACRATVVPA